MGEIEVEADSLEDAKELAQELSCNNLENESYVDGSFLVNDEVTEELNK